MRISKLLESKKFILTVIVINCIILTIMVSYLLVIRNSFKAGVEKREIVAKSPSVEYTESDSDLVDIYVSLLEGCDFDLGDDIHFVFGTDGSYSGFFDSKNLEVSDYVYRVLAEDDKLKLNIYNKEETKMVSYYMSFDKKGNIILKCPDMKNSLKLKF